MVLLRVPIRIETSTTQAPIPVRANARDDLPGQIKTSHRRNANGCLALRRKPRTPSGIATLYICAEISDPRRRAQNGSSILSASVRRCGVLGMTEPIQTEKTL